MIYRQKTTTLTLFSVLEPVGNTFDDAGDATGGGGGGGGGVICANG